MAKQSADCVIWTPDGTWLQRTDENGNTRSSWCGRLSFASVERFCGERGLQMCVRGLPRESERREHSSAV